MSAANVRYFAMVRRVPECAECFEGIVTDDDGERVACPACDGTGRGTERLVLHRDGKLYDEPGKASGSAKRAGLDPVVYKLDINECEPVDRHMALDEKIGHAEAKYIYWGGRLDDLQQQAAGRVPLHRHDPKLTAEDWVLVWAVIAATSKERSVRWTPADLARCDDLKKRLSLKVHLDEMDAEAIRARAETDRMHADWAAGKGPRKCLRVGNPDALGTARTACGGTVPAPATTAAHAEVACCGCERAMTATCSTVEGTP